MDLEVQNAITIAWNPGSDAALKTQAFDYLNRLRADPAACQTCLSLFTRSPRQSDVVRHVALEIVINGIQSRLLDTQALQSVRSTSLDYIRTVYVRHDEPVDGAALQNKLAQLITHLFTATYASIWESFFADFRGLVEEELGALSNGSSITLLYLRILASIHDETADVLIQNSEEKQRENTQIKDLVRVRDAAATAISWQRILSAWRQLDNATVQMCLKTISRWVSWTDINLIANQSILTHLFEIAGRQDLIPYNQGKSQAKDAAIDVFTEIIGKKMPPAEKMQLIRFMNLDAVVGQLVSSHGLHTSRGTSDYDHDMAEAVAKLVNNVVADIVNALDKDPQSSAQAGELLEAFAPYLLRFFSDDFDEVCSTVVGSLTDLLTLLRRLAQKQSQLPASYAALLAPILNAVLTKMRYDETAEWGEDDAESDEAEFAELRKRLKVLQQIIAATSETLFLDTLNTLITSTFLSYKSNPGGMDWRDLDVALLELYLLGDQAMRNGGLYQKKAPSSNAAQSLERLLSSMLETDIASYPHPAIHLQYMEICMRYSSFFEHHQQYIPSVLEHFVRFLHSTQDRERTRSWPMFLRFVRSLRLHLGTAAESIVAAIADLLQIKAEVADDDKDDDDSNEDSQTTDQYFRGQLYLFESVGCLASAPSVSANTKINMVKTSLNPLISGIQEYTNSATSGNEQALLQVHHYIEAIGILAQGFANVTPGKSSQAVSEDIGAEFKRAADTILIVLNALKSSLTIRQAARFALSRMLGVLGFSLLEQLPQWLDGLISESSTTKEEMATFLRVLDQICYGFKTQIYEVLDTLLTPLLRRIFAGLNEPVSGTDDETQLGELRREYLNFLLMLLNSDLNTILVSSKNQGIFEAVVGAIEHFARDTSEHPDAKLAVAVLTKMCEVWGGPEVFNSKTNNVESTAPRQPKLPGFDQFMMTRLSPLTWAIVTNAEFDPRNPQANRVVGEIATLQQAILAKCGTSYVTYLRDTELRNLGAEGDAANNYLHALTTMDNKRFKMYLLNFLSAARGE